MSDALRVSASLLIPRRELLFRASRSSGPGGQHVNRASTRVELEWNVVAAHGLDDDVRRRLVERLAGRLSADGTLRVVASRHRSQHQNRAAAERKLVTLVRQALAMPRRRIPTVRPAAATEARLAAKRRRSERKGRRREVEDD